ncbi:hypothetical protein [Pseudotamlana agarivorans]|uniref:hypothetical protein n=1 Tax=Pseudotamlana agarivorans TaxID=481183 RepID=UPI00083191A7|nr:hypothetical protein [Tamlana agarivorans]
MSILKHVQSYIDKHEIKTSPSALIAQFEIIIELHREFETYLREHNINQELEIMQRSKRMLEKRRLFIEWYQLKHQNNKMVKEILIDLSEMIFISTRTIQNDLIKGDANNIHKT